MLSTVTPPTPIIHFFPAGARQGGKAHCWLYRDLQSVLGQMWEALSESLHPSVVYTASSLPLVAFPSLESETGWRVKRQSAM